MINIGSLSAFDGVSITVVVLRKKRPDLPCAFKVSFSAVYCHFSRRDCVCG